jgi:hypothetical protein
MAKILVIDAPGPFRDVVVDKLIRAGHRVGAVGAPDDASALLLTEPADLLIVSDVTAVGFAPWARGLPALVVTATTGAVPPEGLDVREVLIKSRFSLDELVAAVERALRPTTR